MSSEALQQAGGVPAETLGFRQPDALAVTVFSAMARVISSLAEHTRETGHGLPANLDSQAELDDVARVSRYQMQRAQVAVFTGSRLPDQEYGERLIAHYIQYDGTGGIPRVNVDGLPVSKEEMDGEALHAEFFADVLEAPKRFAEPSAITRAQKEVLRHAIAWRAETATDEAEIAELDLLCGLFSFKQTFLPVWTPDEEVVSVEEVAALLHEERLPDLPACTSCVISEPAEPAVGLLHFDWPKPVAAAIRRLVRLIP